MHDDAPVAMNLFNENLLQSRIYDANPISASLWNSEVEVIECNDASVKLVGAANNHEYISEIYKFFPEYQPCGTHTKKKAAELNAICLKEGRVNTTWTQRHKNGELIPGELTLVRIDFQNTSLVAAYFQDLRPLREADAKAREAEMKLRDQEVNERIHLMFDATPLMIEYWDRDYNLIDCNQTTLEFHGIDSADEYLEYIRSDRIDDTRWSEWNVNLSKVFETGRGRFEFAKYSIATKNLATLEVDAVRLNDGDDAVVITYSNDVSQLRELQREHQRIQIAEDGSRAKSRFLARMSHEIRTPITAVIGISEIQLQSLDLSPDIEESFAKIYDSGNLLLGIINNILDLSKIEADKMELHCEKYETASLISEAVQPHLVYLGYKKIEFNLYVEENLPTSLFGDAVRIKQIVNNILSNAFKYTESGSVALSIECEKSHDADKIDLIISISDTGYGMTPDQLEALFRDYTRFHEHATRTVAGTGLGMAIVNSLVRLMDAQIDIGSVVDQGTNVTVRIPQKIISHEILGRDISESLQRFEIHGNSVSKRFKFTPEPMPYGRVLVVDDVEANLYVAKGLLAFYQLQVETCSSGYAAINKIRQGHQYDIVFMDQMMPGIDGTETLRILRRMGYTGTIVALTANALIGQAEEFVKNGYDGFLSKPIQTVHMNTILIKHIRDKQPLEVIEAAKAAATSVPKNIDDFLSSSKLVDKLRTKFARSQKNVYSNLKNALDTGNTKTAHRIAHTLKGLAGQIGESKLSQTAAAIESMIAGGGVPQSQSLDTLEGELKRVLDGIVVEDEEVDGTKVLDKESAAILFDNLEPVLASRSADCMKYVEELRTIPETAILVRQIEEFDLELAQKNLKTLRMILGV